MSDAAQAAKLVVVAAVIEFVVAEAVAVVVVVLSWSAHEDPLLFEVYRSEFALLAVPMTQLAAPYLFV